MTKSWLTAKLHQTVEGRVAAAMLSATAHQRTS
jgi:hypothetical protein